MYLQYIPIYHNIQSMILQCIAKWFYLAIPNSSHVVYIILLAWTCNNKAWVLTWNDHKAFTINSLHTKVLVLVYKLVDSLLDEVTSWVRVGEMSDHEDVEDVSPVCPSWERCCSLVTIETFHTKLNPLYWSSSAGKAERIKWTAQAGSWTRTVLPSHPKHHLTSCR